MGQNYISTVVAQETLLRRTGHPDVPYVIGPGRPSAPTLASPIASITTSGGTANWTETTLPSDGTILGHYLYLNGVKQTAITIGAAARSLAITQLDLDTDYDVEISRYNSTGESPKSNLVSFHTSGTRPPPSGTTLMGVPDNGNPHGFTNWDAWRGYSYGTEDHLVSLGAKILGMTDKNSYNRLVAGTFTAAQLANAMDAALLAFFGRIGAPSRNAAVQYHVAIGNELDRDSTNKRLVAECYKLSRPVVDKYDNASLWIDLTHSNITSPTSPGQLFMSAIPTSGGGALYTYLDGIAGSYYPPGRNDYPNMAPVSYTHQHQPLPSAPSDVVDDFMVVHNTFGITRSAIWEFGIPILVTPPPYSGTAGSQYNDLTKRPSYVESFIHYWMQACIDNGYTAEEALYWDQQSGANKGGSGNNNPDNRFATDNGRLALDTAHAWRRSASTFVPA
jgi:hypothetical protein